jgi:hypothetical protein
MSAIDLTNSRFGRLVVLSRAENSKDGRARWLVKCDCGVTKIVVGKDLRAGITRSTRSCGCLNIDRTKERSTKHGQSGNRDQGRKASPTYISWSAMRQRVLDPNAEKYPQYGALGVTICDRWKDSFENFLADLGERLPGTTLGRFGDVGNYEPGNCKWMTPKEQGAERTKKRLLKVLKIAA